MKLKFYIDYRTVWGQKLYICGSIPELGNWSEEEAVAMTLGIGETWALEIDSAAYDHFEYNYFLQDEHNGIKFWEFGDPRVIKLENGFETIALRDFWRPQGGEKAPLFSSPFLKSIFKPDKINKQKIQYSANKSYIRFQIRTSRVGPDHKVCLIGSSKSLGEWNEGKAIVMSNEHFPVWSTDVPVDSKELPLTYKYCICDDKGNITTWETGPDRTLSTPSTKKNELFVISDEDFRYPVGNWKGTGLAIPVFSLRTKQGMGVGEFLDIKKMVDWAEKTGIRMVQVLPVNDTVATHTWIDSYPYAGISVFALHPIYANLEAVATLNDKSKVEELDQKRDELNALDKIDYEEVMRVKSEFFKQAYDQEKHNVFKNEDYRIFFERNKSWLVPYAVFSWLRDKYGTPDFNQWPEYTTINEAQLNELTSPKSENYDDVAIHYFIQYHLDRQLKEASDYARNKRVVLKGDIPIGIYRYSVDAWIKPNLFNMDSQAGAPPDAFSVSGQNWGFPTYNWDEMAKDNYAWWKDRLNKMADFFDVFRIDHIIGFFRIWEIPWESIEGIMGRFNPSLAITLAEFGNWGLYFDYDRFCRPYIREHMLTQIFEGHKEMVQSQFLNEYSPGQFELKPEYSSQRLVKEYFDQLDKENPENKDLNDKIRYGLYRLNAEVLFFDAPFAEGSAFNPRVSMHFTYSYRELDDYTKARLDELYIHYFYKRHNDFWGGQAMTKLPALKEATNMLICGEDLGMVPDTVPGVMNAIGILSLAIQRMPNDSRMLFWHPSDTPYLSVCSTSSHDMSTIRGWWEEDKNTIQLFYNQILGHFGQAPQFCEPWIARDIIVQHLYSPSMWAIFPIQDLLAMEGRLRRQMPQDERINDPAVSQHYWRYRFHVDLEDLIQEEDFNNFLNRLITEAGRNEKY